MKTFLLVALFLGQGHLAFISENVLFDKINTITTTKSKWLVTFVIDLKPFDRFLGQLSNDIVATAGLAQEIIRRYDKPGKEDLMNTFSNLRNEFKLLSQTRDPINDIFRDYKTLHKNKRSIKNKRSVFSNSRKGHEFSVWSRN